MKHRITSALAALVLVLAGLVGLVGLGAVTAAPATAATDSVVCYFGPATNAPYAHFPNGTKVRVGHNSCSKAGTSKVCASLGGSVRIDNSWLTAGACRTTPFNRVYIAEAGSYA